MAGDGGFLKVLTVLPVKDIRAAREWYAKALGFETVYLHTDPVDDPEGNYAILKRGGAEVHLILDDEPRGHPWSVAGTGYLFLIVQNAEPVLGRAEANGVTPTRGIRMEDWGARAFLLTDPSGNLIRVAEPAGTKHAGGDTP